MNKKVYQQPTLNVVKIQYRTHILDGSQSVNVVSSGDAGLQYGGGGNDVARSRDNSGWDDWDE